MKKKINVLLFIILAVIAVLPVKTSALTPPYLSLATSQDVITSNNAVLHATLNNLEGKTITGFEIFVYKDGVLVKSGLKNVNSNDSTISVEFDLNKEFSIELLAETTYTYTIYVRAEGNLNEEMYKQSFRFTTTGVNSDVQQETTTSNEETSLVEATTKNAKKAVKKPAKVKIRSAKNNKKRAITVKFKKAKNATKYQVQYSVNGKFKKATIKNTKKRTYTIKKLKKGKTYYIRVRGVNGQKKGNWSKIKKVTINK